jgi:hypothetical protein
MRETAWASLYLVPVVEPALRLRTVPATAGSLDRDPLASLYRKPSHGFPRFVAIGTVTYDSAGFSVSTTGQSPWCRGDPRRPGHHLSFAAR